jgi:tetratricopeptide (TPR) repeat protein
LLGGVARADVSEARRHYEDATAAYNVGEYRRAAVEYTEAYKLAHDAALLFNIAQSYRLAGDLAQSLSFYRSYLRSGGPDAAVRAEVEARIATLQRQLQLHNAPEDGAKAPEGFQGEDPDTEQVRRHFQAGAQFYSNERYPEAINEFEQARKLKALPALDFNIARAYDRLGNVGEALTAYRRYLGSVPDSPEAAEVRARVGVLEQRLSTSKPSPRPAPAAVAVPAALAVPPNVPPRRSDIGARRRGVWIAAGGVLTVVGVALGAAALGTGLTAKHDYDLLVLRCGANLDQCPGGFETTRDSGRKWELSTWVLASVGGAALVTGAALLAVGVRHRPKKETAFVWPAFVSGGAALVVGLRL